MSKPSWSHPVCAVINSFIIANERTQRLARQANGSQLIIQSSGAVMSLVVTFGPGGPLVARLSGHTRTGGPSSCQSNFSIPSTLNRIELVSPSVGTELVLMIGSLLPRDTTQTHSTHLGGARSHFYGRQ